MKKTTWKDYHFEDGTVITTRGFSALELRHEVARHGACVYVSCAE